MHGPDAIETAVFLEALRLRHGYDFRGYTASSLHRRLQLLVTREGVPDLSELVPPLLRDAALLPRVLAALLIPVSEAFRDAEFFAALRALVLPKLHAFPEVTVWLAGCAGGEEAYSMAILLHEAGLLDKAHVFGTDINDTLLATAEDGIYPQVKARDFAAAYRRAGGRHDFSAYCLVEGHRTHMAPFLRRRISFAHHNLTTDGIFCEAHLILCRNVLIYFGRELQDQTLALFAGSLARGGYLGLGAKEDLRFSAVAHRFAAVAEHERIYRLRPPPRKH